MNNEQKSHRNNLDSDINLQNKNYEEFVTIKLEAV